MKIIREYIVFNWWMKEEEEEAEEIKQTNNTDTIDGEQFE